MIALEKRLAIKASLNSIQKELEALGLWSDGKNAPDKSAYKSTTPFYLDTMEFHQWLEFVLIPRMNQLLLQYGNLPENVNIHPYAQEIYRGKWQEYKELITKLREFDKLFN